MAVKFKVIQKKNPRKPDENGKYYAHAMVSGTMSIAKLSERISRASTAARGDVQVVIMSLVDEVIDALEDGNTVKLGDLGTVRISLSSTGEISAGSVTANNIKKCRIVFTPSVMLKDRINRISFNKSVSESNTEDDNGGNNSGDNPGDGEYE
ncbi:MAG: HU family DNA-binding protein [Tannerellaceae bacterium]|nr:HU family DNA-binding protein [Tannerellaceae bacterium]